MVTKAQQIKQLEERAVLAEDKVSGLTEMAGDLFVGLAVAVDMLEEKQAMLELDAMMLEVARMVIEQKSDEIDGLKRAEARRLREQELKDKSASSLKTATAQDEVANWALKVSTAMAKGLVFSTTPDRYGRVVKTTTEIDEYGKMGSTKAITKGDATVSFSLPVFGEMTVGAKIRHIDVRETPDSNEADIRNEVSFKIKMNGVQRHVLIVSGGRVRTGYEWEYTNYVLHSRFVQVIVDGSPYYCDSCHEYHGGEEQFDAEEVHTSDMPEPYRRRSGGCGGW